MVFDLTSCSTRNYMVSVEIYTTFCINRSTWPYRMLSWQVAILLIASFCRALFKPLLRLAYRHYIAEVILEHVAVALKLNNTFPKSKTFNFFQKESYLLDYLVERACHFGMANFFFYLRYLSSIHKKANCIAIFWTRRPHSLGSCLFRGDWATCLLHKGGGVPLSALPKGSTTELAGLFFTTSPKC